MTFENVQELQNRQNPNKLPNAFLRGSEPLTWFGKCAAGFTGYPIEDILDISVEAGTTGIDLGKRQAFECTKKAVFVCPKTQGSDLFLVLPNKQGKIALPSVEIREQDYSFTERVTKFANKLGVELRGVLMVRDHRNQENDMDILIAFYCEAASVASGAKWSAEVEDESDSFSKKVLEKARKRECLPLDVVGDE